jgi:dolichol kinase
MVNSDSFYKTVRGAAGLLTAKHGLQPNSEFLAAEISLLALTGAAFYIFFRSLSKRGAQTFLKNSGVRLKKVAKATKEIERKGFHMCGLVVPLAYFLSTAVMGYTEKEYAQFCWLCTAVIWVGDGIRLLFPACMTLPPYSWMQSIIREKEKTALSGTCYFSLGCTMSISCFPPPVAITSITWLVLGDMSAALFGVSFGGESCTVKLGREGKKSLEGSAAMFITCTITGVIFFAGVRLSDYVVIVGALAATITELMEPLGLNDNISIPLVSGAVLQYALSRVENC